MKAKQKILFSMVLLSVSHTASVCAKEPSILEVGPSSMSIMSTQQYCTGFDHSDMSGALNSYPDIGPFYNGSRRWSQHPILWKHLTQPDLNFDVTIGFINGAFYNWPELTTTFSIDDNSALNLNSFEVGGAFTNTAGAVVDPSGSWSQFVINDSQTTAIFAAMAIWSWGTPVYLNFPTDSADFTGSLAAVINCVTLSHPEGRPDLACNWNLTSDPNQVSSCPGLVVESLDMSYFTDTTLSVANSNNQSFQYAGNVNAVVFDQVFNSLWSSTFADDVHRVLIDPPPEVDEYGLSISSYSRASAMIESSRKLASEVLFRSNSGSINKPLNKISEF